MFSSYLSVSSVDHGLIGFNAQSYGGFAYRKDTLEREDGVSGDPTRRFLTEHNLALFWRRPGLYPCSPAFPVPILHTADHYSDGIRNRPPGNLRVDCAPIRYRHRNLLAGELVQEDVIRLWAINDSSDHKRLLSYNLRLIGPHSTHRRHLLQLEFDADEWEGAAEFGGMKIGNEVLQLRAREQMGRKGEVFLRTKRSLELANTTERSLSTVFAAQIRAFTQIPHLDGELALVDSQGMLFWGDMDHSASFSRFKFPIALKSLCPTDCPRVLLAIGDKDLHQVDLRESPNSSGQLLFSQSPIQPADGPFSERVYADLNARDLLCHVNALDVALETVMVTSNRRHTLIDRRMPGLSVLTMNHAEIDGADYCLTTPSFTDPESGGRVFSLFSLTQIRRPALTHWAVMFHPSECLWSSLGPKYAMASFQSDTSNFLQLHTVGSNPQVQTSRLPKWTRAIHYQSLDPNLSISSTRALLFRQMEGGLICYENLFFDPLPKLRQGGHQDNVIEEDGDYEGSYEMGPIDELKMKRKALEQLAQYQQKEHDGGEENESGKKGKRAWIPHFFRGVQDELLVTDWRAQFEDIDITSLGIAAQFADLDDQLIGQNVHDLGFGPFANVHRICLPPLNFGAEEIAPFEPVGPAEEKMLSSSVLCMWQKTVKLWREAKEKRLQMELGLMDIVEEAEEDGRVGEEDEGAKLKMKGMMKKAMDEGEEEEEEGGGERGGKMEEEEEEWEKVERRKRKRRMESSGVEEEGGGRRAEEGEEAEEEEDEYDFEVDPDEGRPKGREAEEREEQQEDEDEYNFEVDIDA